MAEKMAAGESPEVLFWVGCAGSFDDRAKKITKAFAKILIEAKVDFAVLGTEESCTGDPAKRAGNEFLFQMQAMMNIEVLNGYEIKRIVTCDPHSFNTIRNEYPDFGGEFEIQHYTTVLKQLFEAGKLRLKQKLNYRVTFHDPCHLGRYNKGYDAPRELIEMIGCELVEMDRNRDNSFCCGAGGGRIWIPDPVGMEKPSENRIHEAGRIDDLDVFIVSCPKDLTMFEDARKTAGYEDKFVVKELIELITECVEFDAEESDDDVATA